MTAKQIGTLIRRSREARGWTINRAATESGLARHQIQGIEAADKAYTTQSLSRLAQTLGLDVCICDTGGDGEEQA